MQQLRKLPMLTKRILLIVLAVFATCYANAQLDSATLSKDTYYQKLNKLNQEIPIFYNQAVKQEIQNWLKTPKQTAQLLGKSLYTLESFGTAFDSLGLPKYLSLLSVVNSNMNAQYVNTENGASGIWPLTFSTARRYGLVTNSYVDQRRNHQVSTRAMTAYLNDLEQIYQDWHFVISAFYAGPISLNMAIRKAGNTLDYNKVHEALDPKQRVSLEKFMALVYLVNYAIDHQITVEKFQISASDTVCTSIALGLDFVATKLDIKKEELRKLNPDLLQAVVPTITNCNCFLLPINAVEKYREMRNEIELVEQVDTMLSVDSLQDLSLIETEKPQVSPTGVPKKVETIINNQLIYYTIKSGDNIGLLAKLFDCSITDIKKWNNMKNNMLYAGKKLKIYVPSNKLAQYKSINTMSMSQKQALARKK